MPRAKKESHPESAHFACGAEGEMHGAVVGCCHVCGLLLCEQHLFYQPRTRTFGQIEGQATTPLLCGQHRTALSREGWPPPPAAKERQRRRRFSFLRRPTRRSKRRG